MLTHPGSCARGVLLFREITGAANLCRWQVRLFQTLTEGKPPQSPDIPTRLGKAAVALLCLLPLAGAHRDPFDRMLIAQAQIEGLTLVSNEVLFDTFGVQRLWQDRDVT